MQGRGFYDFSGATAFMSFVDRVLLEHNAGSIKKFRIKWRSPFSYDVEPWIRKAIAQNVEELDLGSVLFQMPQSIFFLQDSCSSQVVWNGGTACLPKLKVLDLSFVGFKDDDSFASLISCCSVLEDLSIQRYRHDKVRKLRIHSPTVKHLKLQNECFYHVSVDYEDVVDINTPVLVNLDIIDYLADSLYVTDVGSLTKAHIDMHKTLSCPSLIKCFKAFNNVKYLSLYGDVPTSLNLESGLPAVKFLNLTHLTMGTHCVWRPMLPYFLHCSENLEVLELTGATHSKSLDKENLWIDPVTVPKCLMWSLRVMKSYCFTESECEFGMLKYILKHGYVLQMVQLYLIFPYESYPDFSTREGEKTRRFELMFLSTERKYRELENKFRTGQKIMNLPKGSTACEIKLV